MRASGKESCEYEYFGILKVKIPRGATVSSSMLKREIEVRMEEVVRLLAHAYRIYKPDSIHDLLLKRSMQDEADKQTDFSTDDSLKNDAKDLNGIKR